MNKYNEIFGPFYRSSQFIYSLKNEDFVVDEKNLENIILIQEKIKKINATSEKIPGTSLIFQKMLINLERYVNCL